MTQAQEKPGASVTPLSRDSRVFVAGHRGMVGSAILRRLETEGCTNLVTRPRKQLDLIVQQNVRDFFQNEPIDYVVLAAAKVGGILANNGFPAEFIYENLMIESNVIHEARCAGIDRLLFLGSSCIYPRNAPQPMTEESLLTGLLEPTNEPYAIAKIAGIKLCESYNRQYNTSFRSVMPTNLYGSNDNFDLLSSHVLPALIRKFHLALLAKEKRWDDIYRDERRFGSIPGEIRETIGLAAWERNERPGSPKILLWGTGSPRREFLHVEDLASACFFIMSLPDEAIRANTQPMLSHINIGTGQDVSIRQLSEIIQDIVGFDGEIIWDETKPDGMPQKLMDSSKLEKMGWKPQISLREGILKTYQWYREQTGP